MFFLDGRPDKTSIEEDALSRRIFGAATPLSENSVEDDDISVGDHSNISTSSKDPEDRRTHPEDTRIPPEFSLNFQNGRRARNLPNGGNFDSYANQSDDLDDITRRNYEVNLRLQNLNAARGVSDSMYGHSLDLAKSSIQNHLLNFSSTSLNSQQHSNSNENEGWYKNYFLFTYCLLPIP